MKQIINKIFIMGMVLVPSLMFGQTFNQSDANGMKQGKWTKNYSNGVPRYEGQFKNDHPYGEFKYYYESGALKAITRFSTDGIVAHTRTFHENKQPMAEGKYIRQKKDSIWLFYSDVDGKLISSETYKKGVLDGISKTYYPDNGNVAESTAYKNGLKEGEYRKYFPEGGIMTEGRYVNNELHGDFTLYFPNGKIQIKGKYNNGRQVGNWEYFDEDGNAVSEEEYKNGE
ncbi:MAG: toxin-antitoxin system YwqK family antitoxin [Chlorobi bacterium]|nr:toxin-antitoxin system YwqK family antitoxin [Chlorobiota bacterium]